MAQIMQFITNDQLDERKKHEEDQSAPKLTSFMGALAAEINKQWEINRRHKQNVIEKDLLQSLRARKGIYDPDIMQEIQDEGGSQIYMMITSTLCRTAGSWIEDIMLPSGERAWGLQPSPMQELSPQQMSMVAYQVQADMQMHMMQLQQLQQPGQEGQPPPPPPNPHDIEAFYIREVKRQMEDRSKKASEAMTEVIEDQLHDSDWDTAMSEFIDDFVTYPNAFIKTTYTYKTKLKWGENNEPIVENKITEKDQRVSPFDIYPSPGQTTIQNGKLVEVIRYSRSDLYDAIGVEGFSETEIRDVLRTYSSNGLRKFVEDRFERERLEGREANETTNNDGLIDGLHYWGTAQGLHLLDWGMDPSEIPDVMAEYEIDAILVGNNVIRAVINKDPLLRRPYYTASFQNVPGGFWGTSPPMLMRDTQIMCNGLARAISNSASLTGGPQVILNSDLIKSEEGEVLTPRAFQIWQYGKDTTAQAQGSKLPIEFFQPDFIGPQLLQVYEYFEQKASDQANVPRYIYNDQVSGAGQTAQGLAMLMESASKGIKGAVRHIDKGVWIPRIERQFHTNMLYHPDPSIKGDLSVIARGSSFLITKAATQARRNEALAMTNNPIDQGIIGAEGRTKLLRQHFIDLDMEDVLPDEEEVEIMLEQQKRQQPPPDPRVQVEQMKIQWEQQKLQMELEDKEKERQKDLLIASMSQEQEGGKLMAQYKTAVDKIKADLAKTAMQEREATRRQLNEIEVKRQYGSGI